jgi:Putative Flp pilus-assembly TadE/G-like
VTWSGGRRRREERGAVIVFVALFLPVGLALAALVFDIGFAWALKRHLQASADAAALAGAQQLPDATAITTAQEYSASAGGRNERAHIPAVTTDVELLASNTKIRVTQTAESPLWFARVFRLDTLTVKAKAVASRASTMTGTPLAVYVHELCGHKGFISGGLNMRIEGGIHSNGNFEVKNAEFESVGAATVYRPPHQGPPHTGACKTQDVADSIYCLECAEGATDAPAEDAWRDWVTPYHNPETITGTSKENCTHIWTSDRKYSSGVIPAGVHCLPPDKKFTVEGSATGQITVVGGMIEVGGSGKLEPYDPDVPVLFYSTNTSNVEIKLNPSGNYDWSGYIINRNGGIVINAASVTSPQDGLLESEWLEINGENFTMLGTFPDEIEGGISGGVVLEE